MVNKHRYRELEGGPPPLEESWWEAVLAEDETALDRSPANHHETYTSVNSVREPEPINWDLASNLYEKDQTIELEVSGYNRGGLLVEGEDLKGFVPISHLIDIPGEQGEDEQDLWLAEYVGRSLNLKVIECDEDRGRVVFSERAALSKPGSRNYLLQNLDPGECVEGSVTNITDFGVFVDLGGVEGLIHVSEISWGRVRHPSDVVKLGELVRVFVIQVDRERARVALSLKRLHPNPWATAEQRYEPGQVIDATITSIVTFGAFARLEEGLDGLIHISEMSQNGEPVNTPADLLEEGQYVRVRVLQVDGSRQRLGLSLNIEDEAA